MLSPRRLPKGSDSIDGARSACTHAIPHEILPAQNRTAQIARGVQDVLAEPVLVAQGRTFLVHATAAVVEITRL